MSEAPQGLGVGARDPELGQTKVRLAFILPASAYIVGAWAWGLFGDAILLANLVCYGLFSLVALGLFFEVRRRPGVKPWRRFLAMCLDFSAITFSSITSGEALMPLFGVLLWVTVGNGLRYGRGYLLLATGLSLTALSAIIAEMPFLQRYPTVALMMLVTALLVPGYVYFLLTRIQDSLRETQAANLAKARFLAQASHDLRQPIHSIGLFTACLRDGQLSADQVRLVDNIDRSLLGVEQLFRSLLDIYTLDQKQVSPRRTVVDLDTLFNDLIRQNAEAARWAGVEVRWRPCRLQVYSDPALLLTSLQNLLSNALKYAPGRPLLLAVRRRQGRLALVVYDQGPGIAAEHLPHLCEEFYRVREARDRDIEGVGLGLSIVQRIARLLDLELRIRSRPGHGTAVSLQGLPLAAVPPEPRVRAGSGPQHLLAGWRVLLIEDDANVLLATATLLRSWGCEVTTATSIPTNAVACDLVITDFDLDRSASGADCIAYLNRLQGRRIPAVVVTGHDIPQVQQALGDPEIPVLAKPVRPAELRALLLAFRVAAS
ncbi:hybrid sensor histidine kinase/response regulator [Pseudomonas oryzihabitans]|uniref:histidine kinase n=1 Tax=Pseudomonas oryzihabitans TaxID=47885 RepID=A0A0U4P2C9_9PSED|nr:hybrid sensor histidine kinase/response regulator [Pseudomonas oryzihabitans]ALZ82959.1 hybrid sensor histidine kinase/response regulator [Pseudomonas oryzihabitans]